MAVTEYRSQFIVYLFSDDLELFGGVKFFLSERGYDPLLFADQSLLIDRLRLQAPHVLIFNLKSLKGLLSDFIKQTLQYAPDVEMLTVGDPIELETLSKYSSLQIKDFIAQDFNMNTNILWSLDNCVERLLLKYQVDDIDQENIKMRSEIEELKKNKTSVKMAEPIVSHQEVTPSFVVQNANHIEDLFKNFFSWLKQKENPTPCLFFKFAPSAKALVVQYASGLDESQVMGVGCETKEDKNILFPESLVQLMSQAFKVNNPQIKILQVEKNTIGYFVYWASDLSQAWDLFFKIYESIYYKNLYKEINTKDPVTHFYNASIYDQKIVEEVERARRIYHPVALIKIKIDNHEDIIRKVGEMSYDVILKSLAHNLKKNGRLHDYLCRMSLAEIAVIMPHCNHKGAALRAERLRKVIESSSFALENIKVTMSFGISEFPTLSSSSEDLNRTATTALQFVLKRGGNKVCIFKPSDNFKPEFEVGTVD